MPRRTEPLLAPLKLLAPALVPSWNFFDVIAPAPRVEYALLASPGDTSGTWRVFRPRPVRVSLPEMLQRLVWNPRWNQNLYVMSCAERLAEDRTPEHSEAELFRRIAADLAAKVPAYFEGEETKERLKTGAMSSGKFVPPQARLAIGLGMFVRGVRSVRIWSSISPVTNVFASSRPRRPP